jgi:hypothetical protein
VVSNLSPEPNKIPAKPKVSYDDELKRAVMLRGMKLAKANEENDNEWD